MYLRSVSELEFTAHHTVARPGEGLHNVRINQCMEIYELITGIKLERLPDPRNIRNGNMTYTMHNPNKKVLIK